MQQATHTVGERSVVSPAMGRYAPATERVTETTEIVEQIATIAAPGARVEKRTERVYSLWEQGGRRHRAKADEAAFASSVIDTRHELIERRNRRLATVAVVASAVAVVASLLWIL